MLTALLWLAGGVALGWWLRNGPVLEHREHVVKWRQQQADATLADAYAMLRTAQAARDQADAMLAQAQAAHQEEAAEPLQDAGTPIFDEIPLPLPIFPDFTLAFDGVPAWDQSTGAWSVIDEPVAGDERPTARQRFEESVAQMFDGELVTR